MLWPAIEKQQIDPGDGLQRLLSWVQGRAELPGADRPALPETIDTVNVQGMQVEDNAHAEVNNEDERNDG